MYALFYISVWLHILAAALWVGGMLFLVLVVLPVLRRGEYRAAAAQLTHLVGVRFRNAGWAALSLLVVTGTFNAYYDGALQALWDRSLWQVPFVQRLGIKLLLVTAVLAVSAVHDFYVGPRATAAWRQEPQSEEARRWRRMAAWLGRANLLLAPAIIAQAVALARGLPW